MIKYTHFYDKNNKLVATLATDHSEGVFKVGLAVVKKTEPVVSKDRGRQIATGRLNENYSLKNIPKKVVLDYRGCKCNLSVLVNSAVDHSRNKTQNKV